MQPSGEGNATRQGHVSQGTPFAEGFQNMGRLAENGRMEVSQIPLEIRWSWAAGPQALPTRTIEATQGRREASLPAPFHAALYRYEGRHDEPFHFSESMHRLISDIVARCPVLSHIDPRRLLVGCNRVRNGKRRGIMARIAGLRQRNGCLLSSRQGRRYLVQRYWIDDIEILYVLVFYLPRFQDQSFDEKMITLFHELYHISPDSDGDLRRCPDTDRFHVGGRKSYDALMASLAREYLQGRPDPSLHAFLRLNFAQLQHWHGQVLGYSVPLPKLIPLDVEDQV